MWLGAWWGGGPGTSVPWLWRDVARRSRSSIQWALTDGRYCARCWRRGRKHRIPALVDLIFRVGGQIITMEVSGYVRSL